MVLTNSKPTIYLAGPVANVEDGGSQWRNEIVESYPNSDFNNPLDKYNAPAEDLTIVTKPARGDTEVSHTEIVEGDKELLRESNAVLVGYTDVLSTGTPMEVMWAYERDYPIALWLQGGVNPSDLSPWYHYHVDNIVSHAGMAVDYLESITETVACEICGTALGAGYLCDDCEE